MSAPVEPVPTLELPSDRLMQWSQMAMLLASGLAQRRGQWERLAWSDDEHAARGHDLAELRETIEPAVRAMTGKEIGTWRMLHPDPDAGPTPGVSAEVGPLGERWALRATARDGDHAVSQTWVSCREETTARGLASEILHQGDGAIERLDAHVQRAEQAAAHRERTGASVVAADRDDLVAHLRGVWPENAAAAVVRCPAWPTLASKLAAAERDGHDVAALLGGITTSAIPTARKPAALASYLLDQATAGGAKDDGPGRAQERTSASRQSEGRESSPAGQEEIVAWVDQLDPSSDIDRVGALGVASSYGAAIDTRLMTRFGDLSDQANGSADDIAAEELAGDRERSAAGHQGSVDDPRTPRREDLDGQALAGRDLHDAAAARATAAENRGDAHAAVARASVTTTPPGAAATPRPTHLAGPTPQPLPQRGPHLGR